MSIDLSDPGGVDVLRTLDILDLYEAEFRLNHGAEAIQLKAEMP